MGGSDGDFEGALGCHGHGRQPDDRRRSSFTVIRYVVERSVCPLTSGQINIQDVCDNKMPDSQARRCSKCTTGGSRLETDMGYS